MSNINNNINFFLEEKEEIKNNEKDISQMMETFSNLQYDSDNSSNHFNELMSWAYNDEEYNMAYFLNKTSYGNDELFYHQEYNVKDLFKICNYYGIEKDIRLSKCKKQDIISTLVYFENQPENFEIVKKRNRMWAYITELLNDTKMKKFILWD